MKHLLKKAFLLLALVGGATSAWADTTLFTYTVGAAPDPQEVKDYAYDATGTPGGTCTFNVSATSGNANYFTTTGGTNVFKLGANGGTTGYIKVALTGDNKFAEDDVVTITGICGNSSYASRGFIVATNTSKANSINTTYYTSKDDVSTTTVTLDENYDGKNEFYIYRNGGGNFISVTVTRPAPPSIPTITTDLSATADVTVGVPQEFSIVATGATSYQWYVGGEAVVGATNASYSYTAGAAGDVEIYCNAINAAGTTKSTVCTVTATMPASAPTITTDLEAAYNVQKGKTQVLTIVADGASSYQWYKDGEAIGGATSTSYTYTAGSTIGATNEIYCKATNAVGSVNSTTATMTVVGSNACELTNVKFSNGAYGAINSGTYGDKTIAVPYMAGTAAPTVVESSIVISDGATYSLSLDGNTLTVTAEDGTTNKAYTITKVAVTPLSVSADVATTNFTAVPSWVFNLYGYDNSKGLKFAKKVDEASNMRVALGNTRQYYFIGAAKSLTLTMKGTKRKVNVYVNGTEVISDTNNDALGAIALDESAPNIVMIESNQTGGDGGFASYAIAASENISKTITSAGWATLYTPYALDFSGTGLTAYTATCTDNVVTLAPVTTVPANTGVVLEGDAGDYSIPVIANSETAKGDLKGSATEATAYNAYGNDYTLYVLTSVNEGANVQFNPVNSGSIAAGKAYLKIKGGASSARSMEVVFADNVTDINEAKAEVKAAKTEGKFFENGKLVIFKNGMKFNANGARIY